MPDLQQSAPAPASGSARRRDPARLGAPAGDRRRSRRGRSWVLLALAILLVVAAVVAVLLVMAARTVESEAAAAKADLTRVKAALAAGDPATARKAQSSASRHVAAAVSESQSWPVGLARHVPVAGGAVGDLDHLLNAADHVVRSSGELLAAYDQVTGDDRPLVRGGRIDLSRLPALEARVDAATSSLRAAERELRLVDGGLPGLGRIAAERDATLLEVTDVRRALDRAGVVLTRLPAALGADRPQRYLLAISNESELRASGGAPLSVAVLSFDNGTLSVSRSTQAEDLPEQLTWRGDPGSPFNEPGGSRTDRFANASFHPDFRTAAQDLMGAATAAGFPRLAGVVAVDVRAVAEVLRATGPLKSAAYGEVTADNVGQKLLVDAYATYADDQDVRQGLNLQLRDALLGRLLAGESTAPAVGALGGSTRGRHVQIYSADPVLEGQLTSLGAGGAVRTGGRDVAAVFSQNGNGSKVDVFQRRTIQVRARLAADGSARVTQTVQVGNEVPAERAAVRKRSGYLTGWSRNAYFLYLPERATAPRLSSPTERFRVVPFAGGTWVDDGHGHRLGRVVGTLAPGATGRIELSYRMPPGTFGSDGHLRYSLRAVAQPMWWPATLELDVTGPGISAKQRLSLEQDQVVTISATQ